MSTPAFGCEHRIEPGAPQGLGSTGMLFGEPPKSKPGSPELADMGQPQRSLTPNAGPFVLVVDDDPEHCAYMAEILARRGYRVRLSLSGSDAIKRLAEEKFDAVVTDIYMPEFDGIELVHTLRERWPQVKVMAVTGGGGGRYSKSVPNFLKHLGVSAILNKPFAPSELVEAIETLIGGEGMQPLG